MVLFCMEPEAYPTKTVIEDLMCRTGPATIDDWTPFDGQREEFDRQFQGYSRLMLDYKSFLSMKRNSDFNPMKGNNPKPTLEAFAGDSSVAAKYFKDFCTGYKVHPEGEYIQRKGVVYEPMVEDGESGAIVSLSSLDITIEDEPDLDNQQLFDKLAYVVKWLWNKSVKEHVHYISFALVYQRLLDSRERKLTRRSFREHSLNGRLLRVDKGVISKFYHDNDQKSNYYLPAIDMLLNPSDNETRRKCLEYLSLLKELGFDPMKEDPYKYDKEFCEMLPCLYVDTEAEFKRGDAFVQQIMNAGSITVENQNKYFSIEKYETSYKSILRQMYGDISSFIRTDLGDSVDWRAQLVALVMQGYNIPEEVANQMTDYFTNIDGYIADKSTGKLFSVPAKGIAGALAGLYEYTIYLLATGDLVAVLINPITKDIQYYYSLTSEGGFGYEYIDWRRLKRAN